MLGPHNTAREARRLLWYSSSFSLSSGLGQARTTRERKRAPSFQELSSSKSSGSHFLSTLHGWTGQGIPPSTRALPGSRPIHGEAWMQPRCDCKTSSSLSCLPDRTSSLGLWEHPWSRRPKQQPDLTGILSSITWTKILKRFVFIFMCYWWDCTWMWGKTLASVSHITLLLPKLNSHRTKT